MPILSLHSQSAFPHYNKSTRHKSMDINIDNQMGSETPHRAEDDTGPMRIESGNEELNSTPSANGSNSLHKPNNAAVHPARAESDLAAADNLQSECETASEDTERKEPVNNSSSANVVNEGATATVISVPVNSSSPPNISTGKEGTSKSATSEPIPCSSRDPSSGRPRAGMLASTRACTISDEHPSWEAMRNPRKSVPLIPRINQYERNPLLQTKSKDGLSELEMFLMEKDVSHERRRSEAPVGCAHSVVDVRRSSSAATRGARYPLERKLVPRGAHSEPHPLLQRSDSGMCEIEQFLLEKEQEIEKQQPTAPEGESASSRNETESAASNSRAKYLQRRSTLGKLEPRSGTCERNSLLEDRDEFGMTELDRVLQEKGRLVSEKGKCCSDSTCKNSQCPKCKSKSLQTSQSVNIPSSGISSPTSLLPPGGENASAKLLSTHSKRVHFERSQAKDSDNVPVDSGLETSAVSVEIFEESESVTKTPAAVEDGIKKESSRRNESGNPDYEQTNDKSIAAGAVESKKTGLRKGCCIA